MSARSISAWVSSSDFSTETPAEIVTLPRISPEDFFFSSFAKRSAYLIGVPFDIFPKLVLVRLGLGFGERRLA